MIEEKEKNDLEISTQVSSFISKQLKRNFGKGPESCHCIINRELNILLIQVKNFMTPSEEVMLRKNEMYLATSFRSVIINAIFETSQSELSNIVGFELHSMMHDWCYEKNKGVLLIQKGIENKLSHWGETENALNQALKLKVEKVYTSLHKKPSNIKIIHLHSKLIVAQSNDVVFPLEGVLVEKGHKDILVEYFFRMSQLIRQHKKSFEESISNPIEDIFITRDDKFNRSYLIFYLK